MRKISLMILILLPVVTAAAVLPPPIHTRSTASPAKDRCAKLKKLDTPAGVICTHGPDSTDELKGHQRSVLQATTTVPSAPCPDGGTSGKRIEVLYGVPQGRTNSFTTQQPVLRKAINEADYYLSTAQSSVGSQHYRWLCTNGTSVTIRNIKLVPVGNDSLFTFGDMVRSLQNQVALGLGPVDFESPSRIYLTFVDQIGDVYPYGGQASILNDDVSDPALNSNNTSGPKYALVADFLSHIVEHEVGHNLGAVQLSAPHSSGGYHCYDENDEMCYNDGGLYFFNGGGLVSNCPTNQYWAFDCRYDDYYNLKPASGTYLATHWNTATSGWLTPPVFKLTPTPTPSSSPSPTPSPSPVATNLLKNPGFESDANGDGRPDGWTSDGRFLRSTTLVRSGHYSGRHQATDNSSHTIQQTIGSVVPGARYYSFWAVNIPATTDTFTYRLQVAWLNASGGVLRTDTLKTYTARTTGWNLASTSRTAPTGTAKGQIRSVATSLKATIYIDSLIFKRI